MRCSTDTRYHVIFSHPSTCTFSLPYGHPRVTCKHICQVTLCFSLALFSPHGGWSQQFSALLNTPFACADQFTHSNWASSRPAFTNTKLLSISQESKTSFFLQKYWPLFPVMQVQPLPCHLTYPGLPWAKRRWDRSNREGNRDSHLTKPSFVITVLRNTLETEKDSALAYVSSSPLNSPLTGFTEHLPAFVISAPLQGVFQLSLLL